MQNGKTSIPECLDKLSSGSQELSNRCIIVTQAEISVDAIKNSIAVEKGDDTTPNGNTVNCSGDQDVVEVSHSIFNPTSENKMSKALSLRQRPVKYTNIWNKLTDKRQKTKPQLNTVNGFTPSEGEPKPIRPRRTDKSDSGASGNVSSTSKAIVTAPLLSSIVLTNDPFTFVPGQMCTPQVAFTAPVVLPSEKVLSPVPENNDGFESSENLTVDSDSETSVAEELVEEVDNPVISYNDPDGKESTFDDGNCRKTVINGARNGSSLDADAMSSPDNAGKKRQRKETKWSRVKRQHDDTKVDADDFSTPTSLDGEKVAGELSSKSVSRMSESMSVVVVLKPSPAKSRRKQVIESNESSLETCSENPLISVSESLNVPDQSTPAKDILSAASVTKPAASILHTLISQENEDSKCNASFADLSASTESTKNTDEEKPVNSVSNLPGEEDSDLKTNDTSSLHQQLVERKKKPKKNSTEARAIRHEKQVIALQKARAARWQKRCLKAKQELIDKTSLDDALNEAGVVSTTASPQKRYCMRNTDLTFDASSFPSQTKPSILVSRPKQARQSTVHGVCRKKPNVLRRKRKAFRFSVRRKKNKNRINKNEVESDGHFQKCIPAERGSKSGKYLSAQFDDYNTCLAENLPAKKFPSRNRRKLFNNLMCETNSEDNTDDVGLGEVWLPQLQQMDTPASARGGRKANKRRKSRTGNRENASDDTLCERVKKPSGNQLGIETSTFTSDSAVENDSCIVVHKNRRRYTRNKIINKNKKIDDTSRKPRLRKLSKSFSRDVLDQVVHLEDVGILYDKSHSFSSIRTSNHMENSEQMPGPSAALSGDKSGFKVFCPSVSANTEWSGTSDGVGPDSISASCSPKKGGMGSSIGGVISQLFDDITTKPGNGFVVNIRLDVERKNCYGQRESNMATSGPVNSRCDPLNDGTLTTSKLDSSSPASSDVSSLSNLELCTLLEERLTALTDLRHDVRSNLLDNIRHVKHVLRNGL